MLLAEAMEIRSGDGGTLAELVRRIASDDEAALSRLYDATHRMVFGLVFGILRDHGAAEEVTMDVYHQVWRQARNFDGGRGSATTWILTLARSRAIDRMRSRIRVRTNVEPLESAAAIADATPGPDEDAATIERRRRIARALAALPEEQRTVIETAYYGGMSHSEIADALGTPLGTVKTRIRLGMTRLRELLHPLEEGALG